MTEINTHLESKHRLKPIKYVFIFFLLVVPWPWKTPGITKSINSSLDLSRTSRSSNLEESPTRIKHYNRVPTCQNIKTHLWIFHNCLICTVRVKRKNIVRNINLCLLCYFIMSLQNLQLFFKLMMMRTIAN